jgi:hypothetical protein
LSAGRCLFGSTGTWQAGKCRQSIQSAPKTEYTDVGIRSYRMPVIADNVAFGEHRTITLVVVNYGGQRIECYPPKKLLPVLIARHSPSGKLARKAWVRSCVGILREYLIGLKHSSGAGHAVSQCRGRNVAKPIANIERFAP